MNEVPTDPPPRDFMVILRALPAEADHGPALVRLKRALKCLLRGFQLKALVVAPVEDGNPPAPPAAPKPRRRF